jgi:broad specificity phosphatase PhoE
MATLFLLRHGQAGDIMGDYDRLSPLGVEQCAAAGARCPFVLPLAWARCGAMRRHRLSGEAFLGGLAPGLQLLIDEDARWDEFDHQDVIKVGLAAGLGAMDAGGELPSFFHLAMGRWAGGAHDGDYREPYGAFYDRVQAAFDAACADLPAGGQAIIFTSGGVISAVCRRLLGLSPTAAFTVNSVLYNAGLSRVELGGGRRTLVQLNLNPAGDADPRLRTRR